MRITIITLTFITIFIGSCGGSSVDDNEQVQNPPANTGIEWVSVPEIADSVVGTKHSWGVTLEASGYSQWSPPQVTFVVENNGSVVYNETIESVSQYPHNQHVYIAGQFDWEDVEPGSYTIRISAPARHNPSIATYETSYVAKLIQNNG